MSIVTPVNPTVPAIRPFPWDNVPYANISPLTIRDNATMVWEVEKIKHWLVSDLTPDVDKAVTDLVDAWALNMGQIIEVFPAHLT